MLMGSVWKSMAWVLNLSGIRGRRRTTREGRKATDSHVWLVNLVSTLLLLVSYILTLASPVLYVFIIDLFRSVFLSRCVMGTVHYKTFPQRAETFALFFMCV